MRKNKKTKWHINIHIKQRVQTKQSIKKLDDNVVGALSQLGWSDDDQDYPKQKINIEKIFIDMEDNGWNLELIELANMLHNKIPHREAVMEQVYKYLCE